MNIKTVNVQEKFSQFTAHWSPKVIGELNEQSVKIVKCQGEFVWHKHEEEDELFYVVEGTLFIELRDKTLEINAGEFVIIPRMVEHKPYAPEEVKILMFEPNGTLNTGDQRNEMTVEELDRI